MTEYADSSRSPTTSPSHEPADAEGAVGSSGGDPAGRRQFLRRMGMAAGAITVAPVTLAACATTTTTGASAASTAAPGTTGGTVSSATIVPNCAPAPSPALARPSTPADVYAALRDGNSRFVKGTSIHPNLGEELRREQAQGQTPFAAVLTCADSRVAPELIFDQGIGDVFVVRVAGNIADPVSVASLAYAVGVLGVDVIITMGHSHCGAVHTAVLVASGEAEAGEFAVLVDAIAPAVAATKTDDKEKWLHDAINANAKLAAQQLPQRSKILGDAVAAGTLKIVAADFDLESSEVSLLS